MRLVDEAYEGEGREGVGFFSAPRKVPCIKIKNEGMKKRRQRKRIYFYHLILAAIREKEKVNALFSSRS